MSTLNWQSLRGGSGERVILTVDYGEGRREAGFPELAANLGGAQPILASTFDPQTVESLAAAAAIDPDRLRAEIDGWCGDLLDQGRQPAALLSYCAGASLACALGEALARRGAARPVMILLEPIVVEPDFLLGRFVEAVRGFAGLLEDDEIRSAIRDAAVEVRSSPDVSGAALVESARRLSARYGKIARRACVEAELEDEAAEELQTHVAAVLHYQAVAGIAGSRDVWSTAAARSATVFVSAAHTLLAPLAAATAVFPAGRDEFLADARLAEAVTGVIAGNAWPDGP